MNHAVPTFGIIAVGTISIAELFVLITSVSPYTASSAELWVFFFSLYGSLASITTLLWHVCRRKFSPRPLHIPSLWVSLRQAALFSLIVCLALFFNSLRILTLWDLTPLVVSVVLIEFFFQAEKQSPHSTPIPTNEYH